MSRRALALIAALAAALLAAPLAMPPEVQGADDPIGDEFEGRALVYLGLNPQGAEEWYRTKDGAVVIRIPKGEFLRRPYEGPDTSKDPVPVEVGSFLIDKYEVTNAQFAKFLNATKKTEGLIDPRLVEAGSSGLTRSKKGAWAAAEGLSRHPVTAATGNGAVAFATWIGGRVPIVQEWEKAASGPEGRVYPWGEDAPDATRAQFCQSPSSGPLAVGSRPDGASPYGVHDMAGNVYDRVTINTRSGKKPVMIKGGSWLSPHPLNLRVLDLCMQPMRVAERSVGFRCAMDDPQPNRAPFGPEKTAELTLPEPPRTHTVAGQKLDGPRLRLARDFDEALIEARRRRVPIFMALLLDTCGQSDRTRTQLFHDTRFIEYCNENLIVVVGQAPGHAFDEPHACGEDGACSLYDGLTCNQHEKLFGRGVGVVGTFSVSPGNFVLDPFKTEKGAGADAVLIPEGQLPKWGNPVKRYIEAFDAARKQLTDS